VCAGVVLPFELGPETAVHVVSHGPVRIIVRLGDAGYILVDSRVVTHQESLTIEHGYFRVASHE
jgi:hypothetical protein